VGTYGGDPSWGRCRVECFHHCCSYYVRALHNESGGVFSDIHFAVDTQTILLCYLSYTRVEGL
jgi:hypothetical protein